MVKVLIVDDAAFMRSSIRLMLEKNGFVIVGEAANGLEAIARYKDLNPDIVTMDITMPELGGIEALAKIKEFDQKAKVVMVSAMGQENLIRQAVIYGATTFIVKPFKEDKLVQTLREVASK